MQQVVKPVEQPVECLFTRSSRLFNRLLAQPIWQPVVSCKRGFTKLSCTGARVLCTIDYARDGCAQNVAKRTRSLTFFYITTATIMTSAVHVYPCLQFEIFSSLTRYKLDHYSYSHCHYGVT